MEKHAWEKAKDIMTSMDWNVEEEDTNCYNLQRFSSEGQDFNISVKGIDMDDFLHNLYEAYENFDVSTEAMLWLDSEGHGCNGAPYEMIDVYNDFEECRQKIDELWDALNEMWQNIA